MTNRDRVDAQMIETVLAQFKTMAMMFKEMQHLTEAEMQDVSDTKRTPDAPQSDTPQSDAPQSGVPQAGLYRDVEARIATLTQTACAEFVRLSVPIPHYTTIAYENIDATITPDVYIINNDAHYGWMDKPRHKYTVRIVYYYGLLSVRWSVHQWSLMAHQDYLFATKDEAYDMADILTRPINMATFIMNPHTKINIEEVGGFVEMTRMHNTIQESTTLLQQYNPERRNHHE